MENILPQRKCIRLKEYDYSQEGYYFITICVKDRKCILSKITTVNDCPQINNVMVSKNPICTNNVGAIIDRPQCINVLTAIGKIVDKCIEQMKKIYTNIVIDEYVIMPNHIHMILIINKKGKNNISEIIKQFKGKIVKHIGKPIWQKSFYEHVIRNEKEYIKIKEYVINNPYNWNKDKYFE